MKRRDLQALCKRHGLPAGGSNAALAARLADVLPGAGAAAGAAADEVVVVPATKKGCLKTAAGDTDLGETKKVSFVLEEGSRGRSKGKARGGSVDAEAGAGGPSLRRSRRRNSLSLGDADAEAADEVADPVPVDTKRERKSQQEEPAVSAQVGVSRRVTRRSTSSSSVSPDSAEAAAAVPDTVASKRSGRRKAETCEPADVEAPVRIKRSRAAAAVAATVNAPIVGENKRRTRRAIEDVQPDVVELGPPVLEVPRNDAPVTRTLRNRAVQVSSSAAVETHVGQKLEDKRRPGRPPTGRNQHLASSVEEEDPEKVVAPSKCLSLRRSGRNNPEASSADSETNKTSSMLVEASNPRGEDVVKQPTVKEPARRSTRKPVVSAMLEEEENNLVAEKCPEAHIRRSRRNSVVSITDSKGDSEEAQNAKSKDMEKQARANEPVSRLTRKSIIPAVLEEEDKNLIAEKSREEHVRRSKRKSVVPVKDSKAFGEENQNAKGKDVVEQPAVKEPFKRSTRSSVASAMLEEEDTSLSAHKNPEAQVRTLKQKSIVPVSDCEETQNAKSKDTAKQPRANEPVSRSTRKSIVSAVLEEEVKDSIAEKSREEHVRRSKRNSVVPDKDSKAFDEENQNAKGKDVVEQPTVKEPVKRLTRRSVVSTMLEEEDTSLIAHKSPEAQARRIKRKSIVPVKGSNGDGQETHTAKSNDMAKQSRANELVSRSTRKSVISAVLEEKGTYLIAEKSPEERVRRSKRKSIVPDKDNKGVGEETQNAKGKDVVTQPAVKEPVRRSTRRSVASAILEEEDKNLIAHRSPEAQVRTLKRKSVVLVKDNEGDHEETQNAKGEDVVKQLAVKEPVRRSIRESVASDMLEKEHNDLIAAKKPEAHDKIDSKGTNHAKTISKGRPSKRKTIVPEVISVEEAKCEDMVITEAICDIVTHGNESSSRGQEICQVNATGEEFSSGPLLVTPNEKTSIVQSTHNVIAGSESVDAQNPESYPSHEDMVIREAICDTVTHANESSGRGQEICQVNATGEEFSSGPLLVTPNEETSIVHCTHNVIAGSESVDAQNPEVYPSHEDMVIREAICDTVTRGNESSSKGQEICQVNATGEEFSSGPLLVTPNEETSIVQSTHNVIAGSESVDAQNPEIYPTHEDMVIREAICDTVTHGNESSSRGQEICQVNATGEEFSSGPLLVTPNEETSIVQSTHNVIAGSESVDAQNPEIYPTHEDMVIREAICDTVTHGNESSSRGQEICQVNATGEEFSSGPLLVTPNEETSIVQSTHNVIAGSESVDAQNPEIYPSHEDVVIREAICDTVTHGNESSSRGQEICQVNATGEEFSSGPLLVTPNEETSMVQSTHNVIAGSESVDAQNPEIYPSHEDMVIREAICDTVTHADESSSRGQEICQVNATRKEFSSGPLLVTPNEETSIVQSTHNVIAGSESVDVQNPEIYPSHEDMVVREVICDTVTHANESSSRGQEICQVNATGKEFSSGPLLVTPNEETSIVQSTHNVKAGSESVDAQNPEIYPSHEDMVIREAICDTVAHANESSSRGQEICQVNATGKEFSSGPLLVTPNEETSIVQSTHNVIAGSESVDAQDPEMYPSHGSESSDKSKQTQEYYDIETDDGLLTGTSIGELDQSSGITELLQHTGIVSEDKMLRDIGDVNFGDKSIQIVNACSDEVRLDLLNTSFGRSTAGAGDAEALPMVESPTVNDDMKQSDTVVSPINSSCCDGITVTDTGPQFAGQKDIQGVSTDASESAPPIADSKQESHSVEQSIQAAGLGKCLSKDIKQNPLSPNIQSNDADTDRILPSLLDTAKRSSSDESRSFFGLDFLFAEEDKGSSSRNDIDTVVEVDYGSKPSACVTPSFCMKSDCGMECENVQPLGHNAVKTVDVGQGVAQEEFIAEDESNNEYVAAEIDGKTKSNYEAVGLYMKSDCVLAENNTRLVADNHDDEHAVIKVNHGVLQEGTIEKPSLCSAAPESKHECRLPEEAELHSIRNKRCSSHAEHSPLVLQSLFSHESLDTMECGALAYGTSHTESGVDQLKDCHVTCTVEKNAVSQPVELACKDEGNRKFIMENHEDLNASCEKSDVNMLDHYLQRGLLDDFSVEKSREESDMSGGKNVSNAGTAGNPSFDSAVSEHKGSFFEEVVHTTENLVGTCPSNPKELLMELQSMSSMGNIKESDLDNLTHPISAFGGDESTIIDKHVNVHSGSNLSQLESNDLVDESIQCSNTEVLHQGHSNQCKEYSTEEQVASRHGTYDTTEAATVKFTESAVNLLPVEERPGMHVRQLNSMLESAEVVELSPSCNEDVRVTSDKGSAGIAVYEKFLFGDKSDSRVNTLNIYAETCPSNPRELLKELQSSSNETTEHLDPHDNLAFSDTEREGDESTICHVENLVDTVLSSESDVYLDPNQDFSTDEGKQVCMSVSLHDDKEGFLKSNYMKDTSAYLSEDTHNIERDTITEEVLCEEKKKGEPMQSSNCDFVHENSLSERNGICQSSDWMHIDEIDPKLSSCDSEVPFQDHVEECHEVNEDEVTPAVLEKDMSEAASFERMESTKMLGGEGEEYNFSCDENTGGTFYTGSVNNNMFELHEAHHLDSWQKQDALDVPSVPKCPEESTNCQGESVLGPGTCYTGGQKSTNESSTKQLNSHIGALNQEQHNENNDPQTTSGIPASGMSETALIERSVRVIDEVSAAGSSAFPDEQLNTKLEGHEMQDHNRVIDKDTSSL